MAQRFAITFVFLAAAAPVSAQVADYSLSESQTFVKTYCQSCHQGARAPARLDLSVYATDPDALTKDLAEWGRVLTRVREASMPPKGMPAPAIDEREKFSAWVETGLRASICAGGITPGPAPIRRLNRSQYSNTIRDLLEIQFDAGRALPEDGAGGEGFDNAAETLFLSPIHAEKYLATAKETINFAFKNPRTRAAILIARPGAGLPAPDAARRVLERFLLRAFRRPPAAEEVARYLAVFTAAQKRGDTFDASMAFTLQAVLIAPDFLFRIERPNPGPDARPLGDYELASRLSYFLWNSMPDQQLFDLAAQGTLHEPETLKAQVVRMLDPGVRSQDVEDDVRLIKGGKVEAFAQQFVEQWLGTRELGRDIQPDQKLFPQFYETETQSSIRMEPVLFMKELLASNLSVLNFLDSKFVVINGTLAKLYGLSVKAENYHSPVELPEDSHRGGLTGMSAILAVSSHADRTSPVLRGKWVLEALLGAPAAAAAAERARARRGASGREREIAAGAALGAQEQSRVRVVPPADRSARLRPRKLRRPRPLAHGRGIGREDRRHRRAARRHQIRRPRAAEGDADEPQGRVRPPSHQQDAGLRAGTRAHAAGLVHRGRDCGEAEAGRLQGADAPQRNRAERAVPVSGRSGDRPMSRHPCISRAERSCAAPASRLACPGSKP